MIDALIVLDPGGGIRKVNSRACLLFGYTEREFREKNFAALFPEGSLYPGIRELKEEEAEITGETLLRAKDGREIPVAFSCSVLGDGNGAAQWIVCIIHDIAERKRAQEALERSNRRNRLILEAVGEGIYGVDLRERLVFINPAAEEMLGYRAEELEGKGIHEIIHHTKPDGSSYPKEECPVHKTLEGGALYHGEGEIFWRKDGTSFPIDYVSTPVREGGRIVGAVIVFDDISERKRLESELIKAKKLESVGILAGGLAHDFNNLLAGIMNCITLAKESLDPSGEAHEALVMAEKASLQARDLTRQLLSFAKTGNTATRAVSIDRLLRESVSLLPAMPDIRCRLDLPDDLWTAEIDEEQVKRVLHNLLVNAREAMPGGGTITVRAENTMVAEKDGLPLEEGKYVRITVEDEGTGIAEEDLPRVFDPYFTTKRLSTQKGMGLGLAISYSIIKRHKGHITVRSRPGNGAAFSFYLPAAPFSKETGTR